MLDDHTTHTKNLEARQNGIILLQLPGRTTHRLQPLDVAVFGPMQKSYDQALDQWMTSNAGQCVTQYETADLIRIAYYKSTTVGNAVNTFKGSGSI